MAELDPVLYAALQQPTVTLFGAVQITLPTHTVRLLDGAGQVLIDGQLFSGSDLTWGVLDSIKGLAETTADSAPALTMGMIPAGSTALAQMIDPSLQGSPVVVMLGALDTASGLVMGEPYVVFVGELDVPTVKLAGNDRRVEFRVTSIAERLFMVEEGRRLSDSFHQRVWPGELGLSYVSAVEVTIPWGQNLDTTAVETRSNLPTYAETQNRT